jgi:hypothetical protein
MQFVLTGFIPDTGFRVFTFEGIAEDRSRIAFTVRTDLALIRRYGIQMQDLPLLCRGLLERRGQSEPGRALVYTEAEMRLHADHCAAEKDAAQKKKAARRPPINNAGAGWRTGAPGDDGQPSTLPTHLEIKRSSA